MCFGNDPLAYYQEHFAGLTRAAKELRELGKNADNKPASVITESAVIISYDGDKNKLPDDLICAPFVSDSPPIVLEAVESIKSSFGKVLLWTPRDRKPGIHIAL